MTMAQIEVFERDGAAVVVPAGPRLDAEVAGEFRRTLLQLIERGHRRIVVDLPRIQFIDSSGLGALVSALKRVKQVDDNGDIRLTSVQPPVQAVLEIIRLHRVFARYPTVDEAVDSFKVRA